jgi:hypothetical protein
MRSTPHTESRQQIRRFPQDDRRSALDDDLSASRVERPAMIAQESRHLRDRG